LPAAAFDVVLCQQGLQFFPDRAAGAREMRRVLAPGGRAVVACWQGVEQQTFFGAVVRAQAKLLGVSVEKAGTPFTFGDAGALRAVLGEAGFQNVEITTHVIDARFPEPERFIKMCVDASIAVMPEQFGGIDPAQFAAGLTAECAEDLARYRNGDELRFPMVTNVALAR
jgi:ubiquinone/menaquinone biosynthesis C-methylase UbiE